MKVVTNRDIYEELVMSKDEKLKAQVKSRLYYIFWGFATVTVFVGQVYVGTGFRHLATSFDRIVDTVVLELEDIKEDTTTYY